MGVVTEDETILKNCKDYFDKLWLSDSKNLERKQLDDWYKQITEHNKFFKETDNKDINLGDFGAVILDDGNQAFVKFLGTTNNRKPVSYPIRKQLIQSGSHKWLTYPSSRRPKNVKDGDIMFIGRFTDERDIRIYGRAIGKAHIPGQDKATKEEIDKRKWLEKWGNYRAPL